MNTNNYNITNAKEIVRRLHEVASNVSDRLILTAPRSVSLVCLADAFAPQHSKQVCSAFGCQSIHYTFRNDGMGSFHKAERTGAGTSLVSSLVRNLPLHCIRRRFRTDRLTSKVPYAVCYTELPRLSRAKVLRLFCSAFGLRKVRFVFWNDVRGK